LFRKWSKSERGQSMVEFALVLPILLLLLCGIIDFGWLYYNQVMLSNAAREGARYAVIHYSPATSWESDTITVIRDSMPGITGASIVVAGPTSSRISATVTADVPILTGLTSTLLGTDSETLEASCTMRLEG
jgi:Flp pilus assembly protein TadG